ncbi:MAG: hypothetical protein H6612_03790 [Ignavibacteriales bacterium]|nr:hypothetical protein [Ignavibacteriales bacterium]
MKKGILLLLISATLILPQNNSLFIPSDLQRVFDSGFRSFDGNPGNNYWQNGCDYKIDVEVDPENSLLIGKEQITYYNNSPDTLNQIVIRIYQDISKINALRDWYMDKDYLTDGVFIDELIIENDTMIINNLSDKVYRGSTNIIAKLETPLLPNSQTNIKAKWRFEISDKIKIRMGNYGNGNFFVAYWYPQISVYDDIDGWDKNEYEGSVEFYNDFSNYEVNIKIPKGYLAWATGELQNGNEVLRNDIYERYKKAQISDETVKIITQEDYKLGLVTTENEKNIWKFIAQNVTDFSFCISKSNNWDGASVVVDKSSGRRALTDVVYPDSSIHWENAAQYSKESVQYLSHELPGFAYPYSHVTSFCNGNRGGGMETPMMANDGTPISKASHVGLILHEIAHNYFPFMMGINERKYAWMDEGWAAFFPKEVVDKHDNEYDYFNHRVNSYEEKAGNEMELPPMVLSYSYKTRLARTGFYDRPAVAYFELMNLLGRDLFKKALLEYIDRWKGKHPIPLDFFNTINEFTNKDLIWFWKPWFYDFGYPDLAIKNVISENNEIKITVKKIGNIPTSVKLTLYFEDNTTSSFSKSAEVWEDGNETFNVIYKSEIKVKKVVLGDNHIPDINEDNNIYKSPEF